jgi:uncharacterized protein
MKANFIPEKARRLPAALVAILLWGAPGLSHGQDLRDGLARHAVLGAGAVDAPGGVKLTVVRPDGPAARAGLQVDDTITQIGGESHLSAANFSASIKALTTGRAVNVELVRGGLAAHASVVLDPAADEQDARVQTLYHSVDVDGSLRRTLLTVPAGSTERVPAVLMVGGIGCYSIDVAGDSQDPYLRLAHDLSARGLVVMRLEKSGVGDSQGPPCAGVSFLSEMHSYAVALQALGRDPHVDPERVYLLGHSIGSAVIPRLASLPGVAGLIVVDGFGRNWVEYELWNLRRQLDLGGDGADVVDHKLAEKEICLHRLLIAKEDEGEIENTEPSCKVHNAYPASTLYMQQVAALNIAAPWTKVAVPVLAIYGTGDFVTARQDHQRIVDIVNAQHPGSATLTTIAGMDHHLDRAGTPQQAYDLRVVRHGAGPYERGLSVAVAAWICTRERCTSG